MTKIGILLLLFLIPASRQQGRNCNFKADEASEIVYTASLRIADAAATVIPNPIPGIITPFLWLLSDLSNNGPDFAHIVECYLSNYHYNILISTAKLYDEDVADHHNSVEHLDRIRTQMETSINIGKLLTSDDNIKVAVYPVLMYWSSIHLRTYKALQSLSKVKTALRQKHDEWLIFYAALILRYWRPYKDTIFADTKYDRPRRTPSKLQINPAEELLRKWSQQAYYTSNKQTISRMLDSCRVKQGHPIVLNRLTNLDGVGRDFLSCWISGSQCRIRDCPANTNPYPFEYNSSKFRYGYACRGEVFYIYSNNPTGPKNGQTVNIQYSAQNNQGWWLSWNGPSLNNNFYTKTCPGKSFSQINYQCKNENFTIRRRVTGQGQDIFDGNLVALRDRTIYDPRIPGRKVDYHDPDQWDILARGAETLNTELPSRPKIVTYDETQK